MLRSRFLASLAALALGATSWAQNTVFNDSFTADVLSPTTYPTVTPTSTGWQVLTNKNTPAPTESGGILTINMASTTSGFAETQALFSPSAVQLLPGTYIEVTATFVPTSVLTNASDNLIIGLFNSGGTPPIAGLLASGLTNGSTTFANGGAKGWIGFHGNIPLTGGSPRMLNRPAQTGANNTVQDVVVDSQSTSVGYSTPAGTSASGIGSGSTTFTNGNTYTLNYRLTLSADGNTLAANVALYNGVGTTNAGTNTRILTYSGNFAGTSLLTKSFDALAIGWRADAGAPSNLKFSSLAVRTTGGTPWLLSLPPSSMLVSIGSSMNLTASVGGLVTSYQWQVSTDGGTTFTNIDSSANPSAATASLTVSNIQYSDAGIYRLVATNAAGSTRSPGTTITVSATPVAPTISIPPAGATVLGGTSYTFNVTVNGTSPFSYQWLRSSDGISYAPIAGATNATLTIPAVALSDEGYYEVTASNVAGSATSAAAQLVVNQPLAITQQPVGATLNVGDNYTLSVTAVGRPAPTYQWLRNGTAISGATNATFTISGAAAANAGIYSVVASNTTGDSVTSSGAAIAVLSPTLARTASSPVPTPTGVAPDARLTITFNQPVSVGIMGTIKIYDASNPTIPVDTIDLVAGTALMKSLGGGTSVSTQSLPVQNKTVGGLTNFNYYPITVSGNTATIYPRNNVLGYGKNYFVTVDAGVFTDATGLAFGGISGTTGWAFSTKANAPATTSTRVVVAADGTGDFYTVQGALDWVPTGNTTARTIFIRRGTYFEEVYFTNKHSLTFLGEDRTQTVIVYPNNNNFNNVSGSYHRMVLQADKVNNVVFANLTVKNSTPKGGSQAEALILNGTTSSKAIVTSVDLFSYQDTLQVNGQGYVTDSHISGDVDYMWGGGPCFFYHCELTALSSNGYFTQIRNGSTGHGYVYLDCTLDAPSGVTGMYLSRIDPTTGGFPFSEVVYLNCVMGTVTGSTYATPVNPAGWLFNNTPDQTAASGPNVHFWEYNSHYTDGTPINVASRMTASKQLTMTNDAATIANYSTPSYVLGGGWTPLLPPLVATQPVAQTVDAGSAITLSVQAFGVPAVSYQWLRNGVTIAGATNASYTVPSSSGGDAGTYAVVVSNSAGAVTSSTVPVLVHGAAPVITLQPASTLALLGTTATLNVWAQGDGPFSYQWSKDGAPISGATRQSLRLTGLQASDAGSYAVAVTNGGGSTNSSAAVLTLVAPATTLPTQPTIPASVFDVTAYGAVGDGATDNTAAIQAALSAANAAGGGTIEFPAAAAPYLSGPITISSNTDLQVDAGAVLQALPFGVYPRSFTSPSHFITFASGATNIEISGGGTIDGAGAPWWAAFDAGTISGRPRLVQITKATNVLFSGVTFLNSPNFHLAFSGANNNVTIFGVTISAPGDSPNTDGMDLAGTNYLVQHCSVSDGDDNIVAKPGSVFCRNLYIADCAIGTGHGVSIGGQTNVGLDGMVVTNCTFNGTSSALRMKADPTQGGPVQNVTFSNITMTNVTYPILFYSYYNQLGSPGATSGSSQITPAKVNTMNATPPNPLNTSSMPSWKNITITNLTATNSAGYSTIWGLPTADGLVANVTLDNVNISGGAGLELYDATNIQFTGNTSVGPIIPCNALGITSQPQSKSVTVGDSVSFSVTAVGASGTGSTPPTFRWMLNGAPLSDGLQSDGSTISGAATANLSITNVRATNAGNVTVVVSNQLDGYNTTTSALAPNSLPVSATSSTALLTVQKLPASLSVSNLTQRYDGSAKAPTVTTSPAGLAVSIAYDGGATPLNAGAYPFTVTMADPNYFADPVSGTLTVQPAAANVSIPDVHFVYDGTAKQATITTTPASLPVAVTYNGSADQPSNAGAYAVAATITDSNYVGSGSGHLTIDKATPILVWNQPAAITYGTALGATQLDASSTTAGTFAYSPAAGTVLNAGPNQPLNVTFTPADPANYNGASASTTITVNPASAVITLADLSQAYDGTPKTVTVTTTPANLPVVVTYNGATAGPVYPGAYTVNARVDDPNYSATDSEVLTITITALVRHAPNLNGGVDGSIQVLTGENIVFNGNAWASGDLLVPGTPTLRLNGTPMIAGSHDETGSISPSNYTVTLNGKSVLRYLVRRIDPLTLPVVNAPAASAGTRNVTLNSSTDNPGDFATIRALTLNGNAGAVTVPPGSYESLTANGHTTLVLGHTDATSPELYQVRSLTLNGSSTIQIAGPVLLILGNGVTLNGSVGNADHPEWLTLAIASGGVTLNGGAKLAGYVVAPSGTVIINGGSSLLGEISADGLTINANGQLTEP